MRAIPFLLVLLFLAACNRGGTSGGVLSHGRFVAVYCDMQQEVRRSHNVGADSATTEKNVAAVLRSAGVTRSEIEETTAWYNADVERWKSFFEDVTRELEKREIPTSPRR